MVIKLVVREAEEDAAMMPTGVSQLRAHMNMMQITPSPRFPNAGVLQTPAGDRNLGQTQGLGL
jgi:hypothetical protein